MESIVSQANWQHFPVNSTKTNAATYSEAGSDLPTPALVPGLGGSPWAPDAPLLPRAGEGESPCGADTQGSTPSASLHLALPTYKAGD